MATKTATKPRTGTEDVTVPPPSTDGVDLRPAKASAAQTTERVPAAEVVAPLAEHGVSRRGRAVP